MTVTGLQAKADFGLVDSTDFKPVFIAGGQLGLDKNATKGGGTRLH